MSIATETTQKLQQPSELQSHRTEPVDPKLHGGGAKRHGNTKEHSRRRARLDSHLPRSLSVTGSNSQGPVNDTPATQHRANIVRCACRTLREVKQRANHSVVDLPSMILEPPNRLRKSNTGLSLRDKVDRVQRLLKKPGATLAMLGAAQHALGLFLKLRPNYTGSRRFHAGKLGKSIGHYRAFHNISEWMSVYDMAKDHRMAGMKGDKLSIGFSWLWNAAYGGYLVLEALWLMGFGEVFKFSRHVGKHGTRCDDLSRYSCQFWAATIVIKYIENARRAILDKRLEKKHSSQRRRRPAGEVSRQDQLDDEAFYKHLGERRKKRKRQNVTNAFWIPGALHWSLKNGFLDPRSGNISAICAQLSKVYFHWQDVKSA